nr:LOW QUALITY PROTEIN: kinesin-like protein KIF27 [Oncorhynchus nerka]
MIIQLHYYIIIRQICFYVFTKEVALSVLVPLLASLPEEESGIIGRVAADLFVLLGERRAADARAAVDVRVSYMELYQEELMDLLEVQTGNKELHVREDDRGNTVVVVARETVSTSAEELLSVLEAGNALRHTGPTQMNERSSRSHAIVTLQLTQDDHDNGSLRSSKLHLVDLSGSVRAARTGNTGLLVLGNIILALSNMHSNRRHNHVPYPDAKITRILRDSLGGSAHTLIVACVSPSHHSFAETLSVLQFASRPCYVKNQPGLCPARACSGWQPGEARVGELEQEVQTLREALREKDYSVCRNGWRDTGSLATLAINNLWGVQGMSQQITILQLRRELKNCQYTLAIDKQVFDLRESELEQKEQLVEQQLLIDRLCGDLLTFRMGSFRPSLDTGASGKRRHRAGLACGPVAPVICTRTSTRGPTTRLSFKMETLKNQRKRHREACVQERNQLQIKKLRSSQALSQDLLRVSARLGDLDQELEERGGVERRLSPSAAGLCGVSAEELLKERERLRRRRDTQLRGGRVLTPEGADVEIHGVCVCIGGALLQSEEVLEALDAAVEFKNYSIQERHRPRGHGDDHNDVMRAPRELSLPEASALLVKYFNKVLCLRESERRLQLQSGEQEAVTREMEAALQRLTLDTDRRLTEQHQEHQHDIQILMQQLQEGGSGDSGQVFHVRLQQLERDLFFYKSSSRKLKRKL